MICTKVATIGVLLKKAILKDFAKFTAKHSFLIKLQAWSYIKKETLAQVFWRILWKYYIVFYGTPQRDYFCIKLDINPLNKALCEFHSGHRIVGFIILFSYFHHRIINTTVLVLGKFHFQAFGSCFSVRK